jgi:hypothetical protein
LDGHKGDATFMNEVEGKTQQRNGVMGG